MRRSIFVSVRNLLPSSGSGICGAECFQGLGGAYLTAWRKEILCLMGSKGLQPRALAAFSTRISHQFMRRGAFPGRPFQDVLSCIDWGNSETGGAAHKRGQQNRSVRLIGFLFFKPWFWNHHFWLSRRTLQLLLNRCASISDHWNNFFFFFFFTWFSGKEKYWSYHSVTINTSTELVRKEIILPS